jgi:hypothetical protein
VPVKEHDVLTVEETEGIRQRIADFDDSALLRMLALEKEDYRPEAVEIARTELLRRGIRELSSKEWLSLVGASIQRNDSGQPVGFCEDCIAATTDESPGGALSNFAFGTTFFHSGEPCPNCNAIIATKYIIAFFVPVVRLGRFRLKYHQRGFFRSVYIGRRLRSVPHAAGPELVDDHPAARDSSGGGFGRGVLVIGSILVLTTIAILIKRESSFNRSATSTAESTQSLASATGDTREPARAPSGQPEIPQEVSGTPSARVDWDAIAKKYGLPPPPPSSAPTSPVTENRLPRGPAKSSLAPVSPPIAANEGPGEKQTPPRESNDVPRTPPIRLPTSLPPASQEARVANSAWTLRKKGISITTLHRLRQTLLQ